MSSTEICNLKYRESFVFIGVSGNLQANENKGDEIQEEVAVS